MDAMRSVVKQLAVDTQIALIKHSDLATASKVAGVVYGDLPYATNDNEVYERFGYVNNVISEADPAISVYVLRQGDMRIDICGNLPSVIASMQLEIDAYRAAGHDEDETGIFANTLTFGTEQLKWRDLYMIVASMVADLQRDPANEGVIWPEPLILAMQLSMEAMS